MSQLLAGDVMGHLGRDPDVTYTKNGTLIVECNVAANLWTGGKKDDEPHWVVVTLIGRLAETASDLTDRGSLKKGTAIYAHGDLRLRHWKTRDGEPRTELKCYADKFLLQGGRE